MASTVGLSLFSHELPSTLATEAEDIFIVYFPIRNASVAHQEEGCLLLSGSSRACSGCSELREQCGGPGEDPHSHAPRGWCVAPDHVWPPPSSYLGTAVAAGSGLAHTGVPVQRRGGRGDLSEQAPDLPSQGTPAFTLERGYGWHVMQLLTTEKFPQQARSALSPQLQRLHPCTQA